MPNPAAVTPIRATRAAVIDKLLRRYRGGVAQPKAILKLPDVTQSRASAMTISIAYGTYFSGVTTVWCENLADVPGLVANVVNGTTMSLTAALNTLTIGTYAVVMVGQNAHGHAIRSVFKLTVTA